MASSANVADLVTCSVRGHWTRTNKAPEDPEALTRTLWFSVPYEHTFDQQHLSVPVDHLHQVGPGIQASRGMRARSTGKRHGERDPPRQVHDPHFTGQRAIDRQDEHVIRRVGNERRLHAILLVNAHRTGDVDDIALQLAAIAQVGDHVVITELLPGEHLGVQLGMAWPSRYQV